ncbi:MAG: FAD-binding oxidoreductase [Hyphomicrobiales bacterium]
MTPDLDLNLSQWAANAPPAPPLPKLAADRTVEVAIIGGGYTGCCAAIHLADKGIDVTLLEAKEIGWGGSGRNSGLVNAGLWLNPSKIVEHYGEQHGMNLIRGLDKAPQLVRALIDRFGIDCDAGRKGIIKAAHTAAAIADCAETVREWRDLGAPLDLLDAKELRHHTGSERYHGGLVDHRSFTIEPLAYARGLGAGAVKAGANVFVDTPVQKLEPFEGGVRVVTAGGTVTARKVIVATGAYDSTLVPGMERGFVPVGYFLFATDPVSHNLRGEVLPGRQAVFDTSPSLITLRCDRDHRILIGNLGWLPSPGLGHAWARSVLRSAFPQLADMPFRRGWAGTLDFTDDHMPWLSNPMPNVYMVGGYNGRGIGPGAYWGPILGDWAMGMPDDALPIPVGPVPDIRYKAAKGQFYANAFRAWRLRSLMRPPKPVRN